MWYGDVGADLVEAVMGFGAPSCASDDGGACGVVVLVLAWRTCISCYAHLRAFASQLGVWNMFLKVGRGPLVRVGVAYNFLSELGKCQAI